MAVIEQSGLMKYKDQSGNVYLMLPITNADNVDGLEELIDEAKIVGKGVITAGDSAAYTATVAGITALESGFSFIMIPHVTSTTVSPTLNVNGLGAKTLKTRVSGSTATTVAAATTNWLGANMPVRVTYDGQFWIAEMVRPNADDIYGTVKIENGGTGATTAEQARINLGITTDMAAVQEHIADSTVHVTTDEKQAWNDSVLLKSVTAALPTSADWQSVTYGNGKFVAVTYNSNIAAYSDDGIIWTQTTLPTSAEWQSVTYGNGKFVAVAYNNDKAAYSNDGINWTQTTMPTSTYWQSVTYGNGKFVAVAYESTIAAYSEDGITWTQTTLPASALWQSVTYGNGKFVAVTYSNKIAVYSEDGITWTQTALPTATDWWSVTYGNGKFVAVANYNGIAAYSDDGINWMQATLPASAQWYSVTYGNGKFVALAYNSNIAVYSNDGITWTQATLPTSAYWSSVTYGNGKFVAVANGTNVAVYSNDGIAWATELSAVETVSGVDVTKDVKKILGLDEIKTDMTAVQEHVSDATIHVTAEEKQAWNDSVLLKNVTAALPTSADWQSVTYGNGKFVAVVYDSDISAYSNDGITWTQTTLPTLANWRSVTYGDGKFVAVVGGVSTISAYSNDGITWTQTTLPTLANWRSVTYGNGKFVAVAYNGDVAAYSNDGINWTQTTMPSSAGWQSVTYGNDKFVAVTNNSDIAVYSNDGITWTQTTLPTSAKWISVTYGNGKFVAVVYNGDVAAYSNDGINWTQTTLPTPAYWYSVTYGNGKFVAVAYNSNIAAHSNDGINWTQTTLPTSTNWWSVTYGNDKFVAVASGTNVAAYSNDGITWATELDVLESVSGANVTDKAKKILGLDNGVATPVKSVTVTLTSSGWGSTALTQTVTVSGVLADEAKQMIQPVPAMASQAAYIEAGVLCTSQAADSLTFTAKTAPKEDLTVYVTIQEVVQG